MRRFLEAIADSPLVFDGAMGTLLYERGVFINSCYDEQNLRDPEKVLGIHKDYVAAGADVIETNSFGANRIKLGRYGLAEQTREINLAAAKLARQAAGESIFVAGSVGPCTQRGEKLTDESRTIVADAFREQVSCLVEGGVDLILFETFSDLDEAGIAVDAAAGFDVPILLSFAVDADGMTVFGTSAETIVDALNRMGGVDIIGFNCGQGPAGILEVVERILPFAAKPVVAMPNAGYPKEVDGRLIYLTSPEYFTKYCRSLIKLGVRGVGGCCGTTPKHIKEAARAVKAMSAVKKHIVIADVRKDTEKPRTDLIPFAQRSQLAAKLASGEKVSSVELLPPRSPNLRPMISKVRRLAEFGVDAVNIPDGPRASARVSTLVAALEIVRQVEGIEPVLHYCCRDRNLIGMQSDLIGGYAAGLANYLIITGDPPKLGDYPDVTGVFDVDSIGLTRLAANLNMGYDLGGNRLSSPTGLVIGVGANPCAIEPEIEKKRFRQKVEAGAEFCITQPVFDIAALEEFLDFNDSLERSIPVIAGIWPLISYKNAEFMNNEVPGVVVPESVLKRMEACRTKDEGISEGIAIARETIEAISNRVAGYQVSAPLGKIDIALAVLDGFLA